MPQIMHPENELPGVPYENAFQVLDDTGQVMGIASVIEYINEMLLPERPLNFYINVDAGSPRAFDMLLGAVMARSFLLRGSHPDLPARIYTRCKPHDTDLMQLLQSFGFQNDDAEIRVRRTLQEGDHFPLAPVGCSIAQIIIENENDAHGLLDRINRFSLTTRGMSWLGRVQNGVMFAVFGCWQDTRLLGEVIVSVHGTEGHIDMVYTRPEFRNRGVASALIGHAAKELLSQGIRSLQGDVWRRNESANALAQKLRFDSIHPIILYPGLNLS